jgi:hypothetical protein
MTRAIPAASVLVALLGSGEVMADAMTAPLEQSPTANQSPPANPSPPSADENKDLDLIPPGAQQPVTVGPAARAGAVLPQAASEPRRVYLENTLTFSQQRDELLVPAPPPPPFDWQERVFLDWREEWGLGHGMRLNLSDRLNLRFENDISFPSQQNLINELRELYVGVEPAARSYLDFGRINLKSGIALGFNPTDYFKTRAVVEPLSLDPTVLREDRLGTVMIRAQHIWEWGSLSAAFAPQLAEPPPIHTNLDLPSFDPMLGLTNGGTRLLLKGSVELGRNFSPELLIFRGGGESKLGLNLAENMGRHAVAYLEWSGGRQGTLITEALRFGRETGTLAADASNVLPGQPGESFMNQAAVGVSYATQTRVTFNFEYHLNQAGFTAADWNSWFTIAQAGVNRPVVPAALWYIRDYALDQQQPVSQHSLFLRADWVDAFVPKLELIGFINTDLHDGSSLLQLGADYYISDNWTVGALAVGFLGPRRSDFGSLPQAGSVLLKVARYF